jgi:hypothetical protein
LITSLDQISYARADTNIFKIIGALGGLINGLTLVGWILIGWY